MAESAYNYWKRVDELRGNKSIDQIGEEIGLKGQSLRNMRSQVRFPKAEASLKIAKCLSTTVEYLMYGETIESTHPTRADAIIERLRTASDLELTMVEKILGIAKC